MGITQDEERLRWILAFAKDNTEKLMAKKELDMYRDTGHVLLKPGNQYCKYCGEAMFTSASTKQCSGIIKK